MGWYRYKPLHTHIYIYICSLPLPALKIRTKPPNRSISRKVWSPNPVSYHGVSLEIVGFNPLINMGFHSSTLAADEQERGRCTARTERQAPRGWIVPSDGTLVGKRVFREHTIDVR